MVVPASAGGCFFFFALVSVPLAAALAEASVLMFEAVAAALSLAASVACLALIAELDEVDDGSDGLLGV